MATAAAAGRLAEKRLKLENARGKLAVVEQDAIANCNCNGEKQELPSERQATCTLAECIFQRVFAFA